MRSYGGPVRRWVSRELNPSYQRFDAAPSSRTRRHLVCGMDATTSRIANYAATLAYANVPADVVHECKRHPLDTVGCALGAFDEPPSRIARALAERVNVPGGARVIGTGQRALPELAAFANGVMARYLDGNDVFPGG